MEKVQQKITWMMEGGLYQFYDSLSGHLAELRGKQFLNDNDGEIDDFDDEEEDFVPPISIKHVQVIFLLCFANIILALFMLFVEFLVFRFKNRPNRRFKKPPNRRNKKPRNRRIVGSNQSN